MAVYIVNGCRGHLFLILKREVHEKYGLYNTDYVCSTDYEFMLTLGIANIVKACGIPCVYLKLMLYLGYFSEI